MAKAHWTLENNKTVKLNGDWTQKEVERNWLKFSQLDIDVLELSMLSRIDSAGVAAIITVFMALHRDEPLIIKNGSQQFEQLIGLYGLDPIVQLVAS